MTCTEAEPLIGASLDGELDVQTALSVDQHVSRCAACAAYARRLESLSAEIAAADLDWSAEVDLRRIAASIRRATGERWWKRAWLWRSALATAATLTRQSDLLRARHRRVG